jgi:hypothetical protein
MGLGVLSIALAGQNRYPVPDKSYLSERIERFYRAEADEDWKTFYAMTAPEQGEWYWKWRGFPDPLLAASREKPKPSLVLRSITPAPGATVDKDTVLNAVFEYSIDATKAWMDIYYIAPQFDAVTEGTFNALVQFKDGPKITKPSGTIEVKYPILKEFDDPRLAKPIKVHYYLLKHIAQHSAVPIAQTDAITYTPRE